MGAIVEQLRHLQHNRLRKKPLRVDRSSDRYLAGSSPAYDGRLSSTETPRYIISSTKRLLASTSSSSSFSSETEMLRQMRRTQCKHNLILKDLQERFTRMEDTLKHPITHSAGYDDRLIAPLLPLSTINEIKDFDTLRRTEGAVVQFTDFLKKTGGTNARDSIHPALKKLFSNECAMNCSWKGIRNNFRVSDLYLIKIMRKR